MKKSILNPYLPGWEYVPDGEPHVFGDRVYVYGSHDEAGASAYCVGDYVCWSAPINDLSNWKYEGVIYRKEQDPLSEEGKYRLFAPDVAQGPDKRYYLYYSMWFFGYVSVAVSERPEGPFKYYGTVHYADGTNVYAGVRFDPAVLSEESGRYLYYGFCPDKHFDDMGPEANLGSYMVELEEDMITAKTKPICVAYGYEGKEGTDYEEHPFFEASSIRHIKDKYYFIYSSLQGNELCYGVSDKPQGPFEYKGVIISNCDLGYQGNKIEKHHNANNHGSILSINDKHYIFYHRHTHNTHFSRQGCAEKIVIDDNGEIAQVEVTSSGMSEDYIEPKGKFSAHICCNLIGTPQPYQWEEEDIHYDQRKNQFIKNITDKSLCIIKYFDFDKYNPQSLSISVRGCKGKIHVLIDEKDEVGLFKIDEINEFWNSYSIPFVKLEGVHSLCFLFECEEKMEFNEFMFQ